MLPMKWTTKGAALLLLVFSVYNPSVAVSAHVWHSGPINCYKCTSLGECATSLGVLVKCDGSITQSCVATFDASGTVEQRGCSDELAEQCIGGSCYTCNSHGCNNLTSNSNLVDCVQCDAQSDDSCVFDIELITERRQCNELCMTALYPRTDEQGAPLELVRSCWDDLDWDSRQACAEGTLQNCIACGTAGCNTVELGVRRSCNYCTGGNCANPQAQTCRAVLDTDQCFIEVDETGAITEMGCRSQYNVSDAQELIANKRLWLCADDNCNTAAALPLPQSCKLCSSRTDIDCAVAPHLVNSTTDCEYVVNTDCYVRLLDDGHTERGCLTTLGSEDYVECLSGNNDTDARCATCTGEDCNGQVHPAERLSCHECSSSVAGDECETTPAAPSICLLHNEQQQCVTSINSNGTTIRGCSTALTCDASDRQRCQLCSGSDCNTDNLKRRADGQTGQWPQVLPISCRICSSAESCANDDMAAVCLEENEYCMTVFDASGTVTARGCVNEVEPQHGSYCDANVGSCHNCNSNDCNSAATLDSYESCIYCDSVRNEDCARNPAAVAERRLCRGQCMTALRSNLGGSYDTVRSCLDDKNSTAQELCRSGGDSECAACSGAACNTALLPDSVLSCFNCAGDCEMATPAECTNYNPSDKCYVLFDDESDVRSMGCLSDLDDGFVNANLLYLHFCDSGDNCNSFDNLPQPNNCIVCNSNEDENCASDPTQILEYTTCNVMPNTGCMTRLLTDGSTQRGCVSSLTATPLRACLLGEGNCEVCEGARCNADIYPADRRRCHRCNSLTDANCEAAPSSSSVCPVYREAQGCGVKLVNSATYRGCETEFVCDNSAKQYCRNCASGDDCNVVDLARLNIGYPGKWSTPPINCYTCQSGECQDNSLGPLQKCADNNEQNCATVFDPNGSVILRGCTDLLYNDAELLQYCDESQDSCKYCKSSGCNSATRMDSYIDCVLCDGAEQSECVTKLDNINRTISCQGGCFTGLYTRNATDTNSALELSRGCLDDLEYDDRLSCLAGEKTLCEACSEAQCNTATIPEMRLSCNYCAGGDCEEVQSMLCTAYREDDQCYIHVEDLRIKSMGCASDLEQTFLSANRRDLQLCSGDNCNDKDALNVLGVACRICNSTSGGSSCIAGDVAEATVCQHYFYPECITHINYATGDLVRGCLMDTDDDLFDECLSGESESCQICDTNNCNTAVYPADWHSCVHCDSNTDPTCEKQADAASHASYCPSYVSGDACVTRVERMRTRRACQSELSCDTNSPTSCRSCEENNCNVVDLLVGYVGEPGQWTDLPLSCYVCADAAACAASLGTAQTCQGNNKQLCSTVFDADGQVVARGCSDSIEATHAEYCADNGEQCLKCKSNECNNAVSTDSYVDCYYCDANDDPNCAWQTPTEANTRTRRCQGQCMLGLYPRSSAPDSALLPTRSCLDDLNAADRAVCSAGEQANCAACDAALCNSADPVEEPLSCYSCVDPDCEDIVSERCVAYRPNDQCFMAFDEVGVVDMGCVSNFETQVIVELVAQQKVLVCDGENCNHPSSIPDPNTCSACSSSNDVRCATNPNTLGQTTICSNQPYTQCVTRIDAEGGTVRGCLSSLNSADFYACLMGNDELCEICTGEGCNGLSVFPANRRRCHQCDSASDPSCAAAPSSSRVCPLYAPDDSCVTTQRGDITYRGCNSSLQCDNASDSRSCRICNNDGCNTINLEQLNADGAPGVWQDVPISCLSCNGITQCAAGAGTTQQCSSYDNCVTVFDAEGVVTQRGCSDQVLTQQETLSYCENDPWRCPRCNSNGCNVANSLTDYVECLVCDSSKDGGCVQNVGGITRTRNCYQQCMTAFLGLFDEPNDSYATIRNCYDDMEAEDRENCAGGTNANCTVCDEGRCNTQQLASDPHSCLICSGDACQDPQTALCPNYREQDQCYIEFDEERSVVALGCLSQYSHAETHLLQRNKRLLVCDGPNCNTIDSIPESQTCTLCSSRTDISCATTINNVTSETSCHVIGLPECYSRVLDDGSTERGCLSSLENDEFLACYNGTASTCDACRGDSCNKILYPEGRASCQICNSESNANCESAPNSLGICPVYAVDDACVTNYRNGVTYRGCASSISCEEDSRSCVKCQGDGCNMVNLAALHDDNHGKWQDLPLNCLTCTGADCGNPTSQQCEGNNEQDCATIFDEDGNVVARGCADDVYLAYEEQCSANSINCPSCKSNDCNSATSLDQFQECIYCDSFKDSNCLWQPTSSAHRTRLCQGGCMSALYGSSDTGLDLIRTCLNDKETAGAASCEAGTDANCVACTGASCNVDNVPEDRLTCYNCEGDDCEEPVSKPCAIYKPNDSCFLWVDENNSIKELGCLSSFRNQDLESVIKTKRVAVCEGADCNVPQLQDPTKCAICDSNENGLCATNALAISTFDTCSQMPHTGCVTRLQSDGSITRGCLYDLAQAEFAACVLGNDENCDVCNADGCNRELFPADRIQCYTCTSEDDVYCESYPSYKEACVTLTESCQTQLDSNITTRGCSSSLSCDPSDYRNCRSCSGSECNSIDLANRVDDGQHGLFQPLPLSCHVCEGEHCLHSLGSTVECTLNLEQDCKTVFEEGGVTVRRRGCADDVDDYEDLYCRLHPELCFTCKSNDCNTAWSTSNYIECAFCNSWTDALCVTNPENAGFDTRQCNGKCLVSQVGVELIRSCLDDKEEYARPQCSTDEGGIDCASCEGANCNNFIYPADRLRCHVCTGTTCTSSTAEYCRLYDTEDYCFAKYEAGAVELMGCASSQNSSDLEQWRADRQLYDCKENDCNDLNRLPASGVCLACDSSRTLQCAQEPTAVTTTDTCLAPQNDCVTRLSEEGHTLRGCLSSLSSDESSSCVAAGTCAACAGERCNVEIYPADRRRCHICNSVADSDCAKEPNSLRICPIYVAGDSCVSKRDTDNYVQRGCLSEISCDESGGGYCQSCEADGCNTVDLSSAAVQLNGSGLILMLLVSFVVSTLRFNL